MATTIYMPIIGAGNPATPAGLDPCGQSAMAEAIAYLFMTDPEQRRRRMVCCPKLVQAAHYRAQDMANNHYIAHTDPAGHGPNYWARHFGVSLPDYYADSGNQIESIGLNYASAGDAWAAWKASPAHAAHVLGLDPFWAGQAAYGFAVAESDWGRVFVAMTAPVA